MSGSDLALTPEELAAVVVAVELTWPRPVVVAGDAATPPPWRFSGRWWFRGSPVAAQRRRP